MILSELIHFLKKIDARPKKRLSQNFLIDPQIIKKIVEMAEVSSEDTILEIGSGPGALTAALLNTGAKVFAVEFDPLFATHLERFQNGNLNIFHTDFLKFPMELLPKNMKVVANLPYHITTPILERLLISSFSSLTLMVQKEVADRMKALPHSKTFSSLSLFVQFYSDFQSSFSVPPNCFYPEPTIHSTVMRLNAKKLPDVNPSQFFTLVHKAFQQRRKMITSTLGFAKEQLQNILKKMEVRLDARPENLSLEKWVLLTKQLFS